MTNPTKARDTDPRDDGCLCQRCANRYRVDFMLPDELWAKIRGAFNLLCGSCIVELIEARREFDYFDLIKTGSRDTEIREVLEGLAIRRHIDHKSWCWCQKRWDATKPHNENCQRARDLWAKLQLLPSENPGDTLRE